MKNWRVFVFYLMVVAIIMHMVSCTPTRRSEGRYSSAQKHRKSDHKTKENKQYVYKERKEKKSNNTLSPSTQRDEIILTALKYTGQPYRSGGKNPETGFDCSGFTSFVFNQNGINISGPSNKQALLGKPKETQNLQPGDLVFFGNEERISHVAIVSSNRQKEIEVIHATTSAGVKVDNISNSDYWQSRFLFGVDVIQK